MAVYLILRAIATLTPATNPANATGWVTALQTADAGDWVSENITGGAYNKVIRWAFEKQGLFQPAGTPTPNNNIGSPPAVDVYIDDGRGGEYQFQPVWWNCQSMWNRRHSDGGTTHEEPIANQTNYAYVKIKNRGTQNATNVIVKAFHANPAAGLSYPVDWLPMTTAQLAGADVPANNGAEITVGPFAWTPTHVGHECMFMIVSADGDGSNVNNIGAGDTIPEWRLVPNDNNIGQRNVYPISGGGTSGLNAAFEGIRFRLKNPLSATAKMEARAVFPEFLEKRDWKIAFVNEGGAAFPLRAGEARDMTVRLIAGAQFSGEDVAASKNKTIHLYGFADGMLVGGMSYVLDPRLKQQTRGGPVASINREQLADALFKSPGTILGKATKIRIRSINVEIEFDEENRD